MRWLGGLVVTGRRHPDYRSWVQFPAMTLPGYFSEIRDRLWQVSYLGISPPPRSTQLCIPLGWLNRVPASDGGKGRKVTAAGWMVTLWSHMACDFLWQWDDFSELLYLLHMWPTTMSVSWNMFMVCCRIRTEKNGGAWCPRPQVGRDSTEWLEIDLGELKVISLIETQGRFGNGQVCLQYARLDQCSRVHGQYFLTSVLLITSKFWGTCKRREPESTYHATPLSVGPTITF